MEMSPPTTCMLFVLFGIISLTGTVQAEWCGSYYDGYFYCSSGCCYSYSYYEECCTYTTSVSTSRPTSSVTNNKMVFVWIITGSVIGGILFLSFVACLVAVCCCKSTKPGRVIQPHNTMQPAYINATTNPVQHFGMTTTTLPPIGLQPSAYQTNSNPQPVETSTVNQREATTNPVQHYGMTTTTLPPIGLQPLAYQPNSNPQPAETSTVNQREATTHPVQYYGMTTTTLPPIGLQPPAYQPNSNPQPAETSTANQREGIQSEPPTSGGLPGNHQVV